MRGILLVLVSRLTAFPRLRDVLVRKLLADTRIRELPEQW